MRRLLSKQLRIARFNARVQNRRRREPSLVLDNYTVRVKKADKFELTPVGDYR